MPKTKGGKVFAALLSILLYAVAAMLLATLTEYITGYYYHRRHGVRLWSYRGNGNNLHGYVCLRYSLCWGLLAVTAMGWGWHPLQNVLARVPTAVLATCAIVFGLSTVVDFVFNSVYLVRNGTRFLPLGKKLIIRFRGKRC